MQLGTQKMTLNINGTHSQAESRRLPRSPSRGVPKQCFRAGLHGGRIATGVPSPGGVYLPRVIPYGIHLESMESLRNSIWNPWNQHWLRLQPVSYSMDIMDSMWTDDGMVMEWLIPYGIQLYSTWIPLDSIWNGGISMLDSMDKSTWIPWNNSIWIPWGFHETRLHSRGKQHCQK
jgi:hypothetical protein